MKSQNNTYKNNWKISNIKYNGYVFSEILQEQLKCEAICYNKLISMKIKNKILGWSVNCPDCGRLQVWSQEKQNKIKKQQKIEVEHGLWEIKAHEQVQSQEIELRP